MIEAIFGFDAAFTQAAVRAFYREAAYNAIRKGEVEEQKRQAAFADCRLIDDVASQLERYSK